MFLCLILVNYSHLGYAQSDSVSWWNPEKSGFPVVEGQGWNRELEGFYDRLPARAGKIVRGQVWDLSHNPAGEMIRFHSNAAHIVIRYAVTEKLQAPHMPATGVSGIDLYAISKTGTNQWCAGKFAFADTIVYDFKNIEPNDGNEAGREYRLYLPLYNTLKWLEIGVEKGAVFKPLTVRSEKPIVAYGTSILQGGCASRPGLAWTAVLGRKLNRPLINLGFSGNGRMEKELIELISEIDAKIYILDCLPNLIMIPAKGTLSPAELRARLRDGVRYIRGRKPGVPIVLAEHAGYTDEAVNWQSRKYYQDVNRILQQVFAELKSENMKDLYFIPKADFGQDIETMVDGIHPNDIGMMRYAEGYEKHIRQILR